MSWRSASPTRRRFRHELRGRLAMQAIVAAEQENDAAAAAALRELLSELGKMWRDEPEVRRYPEVTAAMAVIERPALVLRRARPVGGRRLAAVREQLHELREHEVGAAGPAPSRRGAGNTTARLRRSRLPRLRR